MQTNRRYFGTDGIRGKVGDMPMQPEFLVKLGWAIGKALTHNPHGRILLGKDTRVSGYFIEAAIESGLACAGADVYLLGPMPTPAIAYLTKSMKCDAGIVISASHNPFYDNGVKIFSAQGHKLADETELEIEEYLERPLVMVSSEHLGKAYRLDDGIKRYIDHCKSLLPDYLRFDGLKIVIDCANGANYYIAPRVFSELGAHTFIINNDPNGLNINEKCGSTHPEELQKRVLEFEADLGIAFDGDGDRVIMVDHKGEVVDGDELLFIITMHQFRKYALKGGVVGTQMTNLGLELALEAEKIPFIRTQIGDRYVSEQLKSKNWQLGGEGSGHIIHLGYGTTGDAIISALLVLSALVESGETLFQLKSGMKKYPQCLINVPKINAISSKQEQALDILVKDATEQMKGKGRILLRPSGTEPLMRIMVEGENKYQIDLLGQELAERVQSILQSD